MGGMNKEKLHKEDIPTCVKMREAGTNYKDIAAYIGVSPGTFCDWVNHPRTPNQVELSTALKKAEANRKTSLLSIIFNAAARKSNPQWQAAAWLLERQYPEEFAKPEVQLQREAMRESTEQLLEGFESVTVSIREAAFHEHRADD